MTGQPENAVSLEQARHLIWEAVEPLGVEEVRIEQAVGRIAAETFVAEEDLVAFPRSAMDGYAVRAADTAFASTERPCRLPVCGRVLAGESGLTLAPGTAVEVATGAPIPTGADAVIPRERVLRQQDVIELTAPASAGQHIFPPAEDVRRGERLVEQGETIGPAVGGLLAFAGCARLRVYRRPRVAVVTTGSELVPVDSRPAYGQIRNSNGLVLAGLAASAGAEAISVAFAPDERSTLQREFEQARAQADLLITTGGASVGERDFVKAVLSACGAKFLFREVRLRPARPSGFALWEGLPVAVLPGNPAAAFVGFHEFVIAALWRLAGRRQNGWPILQARLRGRAIRAKPGRAYVVLARGFYAADGLEVEPLPNQCSVLVRTAAEADALILLPEGTAEFVPGDSVAVQVVDWERVARRAGQRVPVAGPAAFAHGRM
jgi:molybdopterin molybdotransferase